jgi:hypothetical protein|tara:strand:+ start:425 stop:541 length:117 start_codon:yes stop_codon:yes gene_type:complete
MEITSYLKGIEEEMWNKPRGIDSCISAATDLEPETIHH